MLVFKQHPYKLIEERMNNMEKTIEIISEKLSSVEKSLDGLSLCHNASVKNYDHNFDIIGKWHKSDRKFHKFVVVAGVRESLHAHIPHIASWLYNAGERHHIP